MAAREDPKKGQQEKNKRGVERREYIHEMISYLCQSDDIPGSRPNRPHSQSRVAPEADMDAGVGWVCDADFKQTVASQRKTWEIRARAFIKS